jgi:hypothetical protein
MPGRDTVYGLLHKKGPGDVCLEKGQEGHMRHETANNWFTWNTIGGAFLMLALAIGAAAQTKKTAAPAAPGSGVGGSNGSGVGGTTGVGTGTATGSGTGTPSGSVVAPPSGNATGQAGGAGIGSISGGGTGSASGTGTGASRGAGTGSGKGSGTGSGTGAGTGTNTGASTGGTAARRTYIKEMNGRCYYVTAQGAKRYVARSNCAQFP